jgi:RimJ/RimL family protein N-acetyltransferase
MGIISMRLTTSRLLIDELRADDLEGLFGLFGDPATLELWPRLLSREEVRELIERQLISYRDRGFGLWAVRSLADGELLGDCGLQARQGEMGEEIEIAWHLKRACWGRGLASDAARAVVAHAFGELGMRRLIALVLPENLPSARVARRIGMTLVGEMLHAGLCHRVYRLDAPAPKMAAAPCM